MRRFALALAALVLLLPVRAATAAPVQIRAPFALDSIHMVTTTAGWAIAGVQKTAVYHTSDSGQDWRPVLLNGSAVTGAAFVDAQAARVAVTRSYGARTIRVYRTNDAGAHWTSSVIAAPPLSTGSILQLDFPDRQHGWLLSGVTPGMGHLIYTLWRSTDGGAHWTKVAFDLESQVSAGAFPGCNCLGGGNDGITFRVNGMGWVTGEPFATSPPWLYFSRNAGQRWNAQRLSPVAGHVVQVTHSPVFVGGGVGYLPVQLTPPGLPHEIVGVYVTHDGGRSWRPTATVSSTSPANADTGQFSDSFVPGGQGWIAANGFFWHTADGGQHWQLLHPTGWSRTIDQIQFLNSSAGFALPGSSSNSLPRYLLRTRDGGRSWQRVSTYDLGR